MIANDDRLLGSIKSGFRFDLSSIVNNLRLVLIATHFFSWNQNRKTALKWLGYYGRIYFILSLIVRAVNLVGVIV